MSEEELSILYHADKISVDKKYYYIPEEESAAPILVNETDILPIINEQKTLYQSVNNTNHSSTSDTQISGGGYLEQYIYIANSAANTSQYFVSYKANWIKQPNNRKTDAFGVTVSNAT